MPPESAKMFRRRQRQERAAGVQRRSEAHLDEQARQRQIRKAGVKERSNLLFLRDRARRTGATSEEIEKGTEKKFAESFARQQQRIRNPTMRDAATAAGAEAKVARTKQETATGAQIGAARSRLFKSQAKKTGAEAEGVRQQTAESVAGAPARRTAETSSEALRQQELAQQRQTTEARGRFLDPKGFIQQHFDSPEALRRFQQGVAGVANVPFERPAAPDAEKQARTANLQAKTRQIETQIQQSLTQSGRELTPQQKIEFQGIQALLRNDETAQEGLDRLEAFNRKIGATTGTAPPERLDPNSFPTLPQDPKQRTDGQLFNVGGIIMRWTPKNQGNKLQVVQAPGPPGQ